MREQSTRKERISDKRRAIEEMVEAIVEEKWQQLRVDLDDIHSNFQDFNKRLSSIEETLRSVKDEKKSEIGEIDDKIESYKQSMSEMSSRVGAMEGAIKSTMTPMMQTLRGLTSTLRDMKGAPANQNDRKQEASEDAPKKKRKEIDFSDIVKE